VARWPVDVKNAVVTIKVRCVLEGLAKKAEKLSEESEGRQVGRTTSWVVDPNRYLMCGIAGFTHLHCAPQS
jgi:hypothetical protein